MTNASNKAPEFGFELGDVTDALGAVMRHVSDCVLMLDLDGRVLEWNGSCEMVFGWRADEVLGTRLPHVPEEMRLRAIADMRSIAATGRVVEREGFGVRSDGSRMGIHYVVVPVNDSDGHVAGMIALARELSDDERLERRRHDFSALVASRLRDPLAAISGTGQLITRPEIARDPRRLAAASDAIVRNAEEASRFVRELLIVTHIEQGTIVPQLEPVDLSALASEAVRDLGDAGAIVLFDFDPTLPPVPADPRHLASVLHGVLSMALAHAEHGLRIIMSTYGTLDEAVIEVKIERESSGSAAPALTEHSEPTVSLYSGMILTLASGVAEAHGGNAIVVDDPDGAQRLVMTLPMTPITQE